MLPSPKQYCHASLVVFWEFKFTTKQLSVKALDCSFFVKKAEALFAALF